MRHVPIRAWAALALLLAAATAFAASPVPVTFGPSRDGSLHDLQKKVDRLVGFGRIDVRRDYIGARPEDPDPWFWVNNGVKAISIQLIDRKSPHANVGWYADIGTRPRIDGIDDGVVINDWKLRGNRTLVRLPASVTRFGFYVDYDGGDEDDDGHGYRYFTNRVLNDRGYRGAGAWQAPYDGDVQMLVYDASRWLGADTWLVACEYSDAGARQGNGQGECDHDYSDILFTVSGLGATPTLRSTFTSLKALYR